MMERSENVLKITQRLILMTVAVIFVISIIFGITLYLGQRFNISFLCFGCGLIGGFISIQQRLRKFHDDELLLLSKSLFQIVLIPVYGGIFSLILYVAFLGQIVTGAAFPHFYIPAFSNPPDHLDMQRFLSETSPESGVDVAKLLFWCVVAGFSERFIPQIISRKG